MSVLGITFLFYLSSPTGIKGLRERLALAPERRRCTLNGIRKKRAPRKAPSKKTSKIGSVWLEDELRSKLKNALVAMACDVAYGRGVTTARAESAGRYRTRMGVVEQ